jgi:hypothetical protein
LPRGKRRKCASGSGKGGSRERIKQDREEKLEKESQRREKVWNGGTNPESGRKQPKVGQPHRLRDNTEEPENERRGSRRM